MNESPPPHWLDFGNELRELRRYRKLTQRELAERVGIDFSYISKLERGRNQPPSTETINALARVLDVDRARLYRHIWKAAPDNMTRSALEERVKVLDAAVRAIRDAWMRYSQDEVHHRTTDWQAFERMVDGAA
jgi:transcriptional regulator with XRE-family HTH domain